MRKITAILFLTITCIGYSCYHFICLYQIQSAKEQAAQKMLRQIPENLLTKIEEDKALRWSGDDELWYGNQMFDVVKKVSQNGKEYLMCIADADETTALKKIAELARPGSGSNTNGREGVKIKTSLQDIFCNSFCQEAERLYPSTGINYFYDYTPQLSELNRKIFIPPPQI